MALYLKRLLLALFLFLPLTTWANPQYLVFTHVVSPDTPKGKMAIMFKTIVERKMGAKYNVVIHPNSELLDDGEAVEAIARGEIHFAVPSVSKFGAYTSKLRVYDLPFLFPNMEAVERFQDGPKGKALLNSMESKGILGLGYLHNGLKQLSANKEFHKPSDLAGLSFRIMDSEVLEKQFQAVDAFGVPMAFADVYEALATGLIQGQENTWSNIYTKKFYEYQPYIMESNHGVLDYMAITNAKFWNSLNEEDRRHFEYALGMALKYGNAVARAKAQNDRDELRNIKGVNLIELTPKELQIWQQAMKPVWETYEGDIGKDVIEAAVNAGKS